MSRSIHTTVHQWADVGTWDFADEDRKARQRLRLLAKLMKKRDLTRQVVAGRRAASAERAPAVAVVDSVPIGVEDAGPFVHYPAGLEDLRAVMHRLPRGVLDGLQRVDLQLGAEAQDGTRDCPCGLVPDPYVGRRGGQFAPGVYQGHVLGTYHPRSARIFVFGYVYDRALEDRELVELEIRRRMLSTFVHEVAHHDDEMRRTGRGRWLADDTVKAEVYAKAGARRWLDDCVEPYLSETYGEEIQRLLVSKQPNR